MPRSRRICVNPGAALRLSALLLLAVAPGARAQTAANSTSNDVRLVLQITVDQLRGDLLRRYQDRFGEGGFRYLLEGGTVYEDAHHAHANTETIVGHATLATGAHPSTHGMIGNVWLDRQAGQVVYNIEDARYRLLTAGADVDDDTEIDPTQRVARSDGRSPAAILVSTLSDEMALFFGPRSKIFGVSVKDRGAVSMAGHAGEAFWLSKAKGEFVTSTYYYEQYPSWVVDWNEARGVDRWHQQSWELMHDRDTYTFGARDDRPYETDLAGFGRVFPHPYGEQSGGYYTTLLTISPAGDELTLDFARTLIESEGLGQDEVPDYLAVSFSSTDYVGHIFGPSSLESEDNLLRLDRTVADLLGFVDARVGLANTLIVLAADHGGAEAPPYLNELGIEARYFNFEEVDREPAIQALADRFGGESLIESFNHPYLNLDRQLIRERGLDPLEVEDAVAEQLMKIPGVALAVSSERLSSGRLPNTPLVDRISRNFNPARSGDIYVVLEPHTFVNDFDGLVVTSTHGSPWAYDTYVPVIFAGAGITAQRVYRRVHTVDVAPTLAAFLGVKPPSGSVGDVLVEVLRGSR